MLLGKGWDGQEAVGGRLLLWGLQLRPATVDIGQGTCGTLLWVAIQ